VNSSTEFEVPMTFLSGLTVLNRMNTEQTQDSNRAVKTEDSVTNTDVLSDAETSKLIRHSAQTNESKNIASASIKEMYIYLILGAATNTQLHLLYINTDGSVLYMLCASYDIILKNLDQI